MKDGDKKIEREILAMRPDSKLDPVFKTRLKTELVRKAEELNIFGAPRRPSFLFGLGYALSGAFATTMVILLLLFTSGGAPFWKTSGPVESAERILSAGVNIREVAENSFGPLELEGVMDLPEKEAVAETFRAPDAQTSLMMPAPQPVAVSGPVYAGGDFESLPAQMKVLRKIRSANDENKGDSLLKRLSFGVLDISSFDEPTIKNFSFTDKDGEYQIDVDFSEEAVDINSSENDTESFDDASESLVGEKVFDAEVFIEIARTFLQKHNVSLSSYGAPEIDGHSVVYPLMVEGRFVVDESGKKEGIYVYINSARERVAGVSGIGGRNYEGSFYEVETDREKIIEKAFLAAGADADVRLGMPSLAYLKARGRGGEYLVPAFVFPVLEKPADFYRENIVVPVLKNAGKVMGEETEKTFEDRRDESPKERRK